MPLIAYGAGNWFMHVVFSTLIHLAIYRLVSPLFRMVGPIGTVILAGIILAVAFTALRRARDY